MVVTYAPDGHRSAFSRSWLAGHALGPAKTEPGQSQTEPETGTAKAMGGPRTPRNSGCPRTSAGCPRPAGRAIWPSPRTGRAPWTRCSAGVSCCSMACPPNRARCSRSPRASGSCGRRTTAGCSTSGSSRARATWPTPAAGSCRTPTTPTATRCRPSSCCTACARRTPGEKPAWSTGSRPPAELRATDRETFDLIARTPVPFGYQDKSTELRASQPLIQLSPHGRIRGVRFNNRSARPLRLPYAEVIAFYAAYRRWAELLARPERQLNLRLAPGDCLIFDNTRVLHARTAFSVTGGRHLQGCYADLDGLASTLAVLRREETP